MGVAAATPNAAQLQAMMQSAVALAAAEEAKQLPEAGERVPDPLSRAKSRVGGGSNQGSGG
jgi:hypothetical protein